MLNPVEIIVGHLDLPLSTKPINWKKKLFDQKNVFFSALGANILSFLTDLKFVNF